MANTGHDWDAAWTTIDAVIALTQGGTTTDTSAAISLDGKSACEVSIDTDYSNHAKVTAGLRVYLLRDINGTDYEASGDNPWGFEMPFTQSGSNRRTFSVDPGMVGSFKILLDWGNTTANSVATTATSYRTASIPVAS
jgi:hypothetical protein